MLLNILLINAPATFCAALYMYQATMPVGTPHLWVPLTLLMHHLEIWEKYISSTFFFEELCFPTRVTHFPSRETGFTGKREQNEGKLISPLRKLLSKLCEINGQIFWTNNGVYSVHYSEVI